MPIYSPLSGGVGYAANTSGLQIVDEVLTTLAKQFTPRGFLYDQIVAPMPVEYNKSLVFRPGFGTAT